MIQGQSKLQSFLEANTNTFVGFFITLFVSPTIYRLVGMHYTFGQLWIVTAIFTVVSIIRGYVIRRWFNKKEANQDSILLKEIDLYKQALVLQSQLNLEEQREALILINEYRIELDKKNKELDMCKHTYQAFVSDAVENSYLAEYQTSNKSNLEDGN